MNREEQNEKAEIIRKKIDKLSDGKYSKAIDRLVVVDEMIKELNEEKRSLKSEIIKIKKTLL